MLNIERVENWISGDYSKKIQHILLFFLFLLALSHRVFDHLFGCNIESFIKNIYIRHLITVLFLYLVVDMNIDNTTTPMNPVLSFVFTLFLYFLAILLLHSNQVFVFFILILVFLILLLNKFKAYLNIVIMDQEIKQEKYEIIFKSNNVFVILIILTIIIGSLSSFDYRKLRSLFHDTSCKKK
tara:strand:- start:2062 stop:2610 length:549 start_codon:yes stop_codon:yes gene_type:complete